MKKVIIMMLGLLLTAAFTNEANAQKRTTTKRVTTTKVERVPRARVVYRKPTAKVVATRSIPNKKVVVSHRGVNYYYANNRFYRPYNGRYIAVAPKVGLRIGFLPLGYRTVVFAGRNHFYYDGIYYDQIGDEYEVVYPEIGTLIYELPDNYEKVVYDGQLLYEVNGVLYERVQVDGTRAYEVVGIVED
ncbi:MAG: DUF6515 family protein [Maribacter sp.]|uniref:DUF6515 family protein n=1 Tax=Maribacter sp. TaxID=1897614 RepID=UPI003C742EE5